MSKRGMSTWGANGVDTPHRTSVVVAVVPLQFLAGEELAILGMLRAKTDVLIGIVVGCVRSSEVAGRLSRLREVVDVIGHVGSDEGVAEDIAWMLRAGMDH